MKTARIIYNDLQLFSKFSLFTWKFLQKDIDNGDKSIIIIHNNENAYENVLTCFHYFNNPAAV
jgi:hypothetical protein